MGSSLVEKIASAHTVGLPAGDAVKAGDFIRIRPRHIMTHDNTSAVMAKFKSIGAARIADPRQPVYAIDHDIQNVTPENLGKYAKIEKFAHEQGVDFYPAGTGISHQVMVEYGYAIPGAMVVGSDSHSNLYGAVSALGTPVVRTDAAAIWATGETWWQVPRSAKVILNGKLRPGVVGKDVIVTLCGLFNNDEVLNMAVEFSGDGISSLSMDQRMSVANMTTEWGALAGVFPFDEVLRDYLLKRAQFFSSRGIQRYSEEDVHQWFAERLESDSDARYAVELELDLASVVPHVSGPDHVKVMHSLPEIERERIPVNKAYLLSCVNARLEDLGQAADIVRGQSVAEGVEFYVAAASAHIQAEAEELGYWKDLEDAGAIFLPPGCGTCIGLGKGTLEPGEVGISATNRNFKGRMGSRDAKAYLGSPAVVAASALAGYIKAPIVFEDTAPIFSSTVPDYEAVEAGAVEVIDGFPRSVTGRLVWLPVDNLNTDGIYAGALTYRDDVGPEEMANAAMGNYDPEFAGISQTGDILAAGANFGTGSSREQAATCLKTRGITCVIAESFSETYKRNAINNGFLVVECPPLIARLRAMHESSDALTIPAGEAHIDFETASIRFEEETYSFPAIGPVPQEVIAAGGAEAVVAQRLASEDSNS